MDVRDIGLLKGDQERRFGPAPGACAGDLRTHHPLTNHVLAAICFAESAVARHNRAFGLTAFVVAEKA